MLKKKEIEFLVYWEKKRLENKFNPFFFIKGFAVGLVIGLLISLSLVLGWYKRANMDANTKLNPLVLLLAIVLIGVFLAIFYNGFRYEECEQHYLELKHKEKESVE